MYAEALLLLCQRGAGTTIGDYGLSSGQFLIGGRIDCPSGVRESLVSQLDLPAERPVSVKARVEMSFRKAWAVPSNG